jgi:hypothetical protein
VAAIIRIIILLSVSPLALINDRNGYWYVAFFKWIVVLRWGLGLETWVHRYDQLSVGDVDFVPDNQES